MLSALAFWLWTLRRVFTWTVGRPEFAEISQDRQGALALLHHGSAYLTVEHVLTHCAGTCTSTHPPTAFLFALPLAFMSPSVASQVWLGASLSMVLVSAWTVGLRRSLPFSALALLLWPVFLNSLDQLTPIWLLGLALAFRFRDRSFVAGVCIGIASLPKFLAAVSLLPFIRQRDWHALAGFALVWAVAATAVLALNGDVVRQYFAANRVNAFTTTARMDNSAMFPWLWHVAGSSGVLLGLTLVALVSLAVCMRPLDEGTWAMTSWLGVALLPIAWVYSLLPLFPAIVVLWRGSAVQRAAAVLCFGLPFLGSLPGSNPTVIVAVMVIAALGLMAPVLDGRILPSRLSKERTTIGVSVNSQKQPVE